RRDHGDEVAIARRRRLWIAGEGGDDTFAVVADLPRALGVLLRLVVGEMNEIAAHETGGSGAVSGAAFVVKVGDLSEAAIAHRRRERRHDQPTAEPRRKLDRRL